MCGLTVTTREKKVQEGGCVWKLLPTLANYAGVFKIFSLEIVKFAV